MELIPRPYPNVGVDVVKLKFGHDFVITTHTQQWVWLRLHYIILVKSC